MVRKNNRGINVEWYKNVYAVKKKKLMRRHTGNNKFERYIKSREREVFFIYKKIVNRIK